MDIKYYEKKLKKRQKTRDDAEVFWDNRAEQFSKSQNLIGYEIPNQVRDILSSKGILDGKSVLDVGGGGGRYAIVLGQKAEKVTMTDILKNMLNFAEINAKKEGLDNLDYVKLDWTRANLKELAWEKKFDLVFASMCPATREKEGIDKMIMASRGYCNINQYVVMTDNISEAIKDALDMNNDYDPHNGRDVVEGMFNILWLQGYNPEISYIKNESTREDTLEDTFTYYSGKYLKAAEEKAMDLKRIIEKNSINGKVTIKRKNLLAMITWQV